MRSKVTIVGVGNVGASCALWLAKRGIADLVLVDIPMAKTMPVGKGLDLLQTGPIEGFNARIKGNADGSYEGTEKSDIVIITGLSGSGMSSATNAFEDLGYFCVDARDSKPGKPIFNRTVTLRDSWAKEAAKA